MEAYLFQKIAFFHLNFELVDSGLIFGHFPMFLEFGEEKKLALKFVLLGEKFPPLIWPFSLTFYTRLKIHQHFLQEVSLSHNIIF